MRAYFTKPTTCLLCLQRAGLGPPADLLSAAGMPDHQKVGKELAPTAPHPSGFACGQPAPSSAWGCAARLAACWRTPLKQVAADWMTMQLHSAVQLSASRTCRRRRGHKGQYWIRDSFFGKLIAATAIQISERSQFRHNSRRPSAPASTRVSAPAARGSGCGQRCRRTALHRALTCRRLFERSAASAQRVGRHRSLNGVTQVCPERSAGTQTVGFVFFAHFLAQARK